MLAVDRCVALVPLAQRDSTPVGVLIYQSAVLDALLALFEYVWDKAVMLHMVDPLGAQGVADAAFPKGRLDGQRPEQKGFGLADADRRQPDRTDPAPRGACGPTAEYSAPRGLRSSPRAAGGSVACPP